MKIKKEKDRKQMANEALNMDCMDYMRKCSDKQFNLAIVDPPYGIQELTGRKVLFTFSGGEVLS